jgi:hypothetical protein
MSRGPQYKPGDKVVYRANKLNPQAVRRGQVKRVVSEEDDVQQQKYIIKDMASGQETSHINNDIIRRM